MLLKIILQGRNRYVWINFLVELPQLRNVRILLMNFHHNFYQHLIHDLRQSSQYSVTFINQFLLCYIQSVIWSSIMPKILPSAKSDIKYFFSNRMYISLFKLSLILNKFLLNHHFYTVHHCFCCVTWIISFSCQPINWYFLEYYYIFVLLLNVNFQASASHFDKIYIAFKFFFV